MMEQNASQQFEDNPFLNLTTTDETSCQDPTNNPIPESKLDQQTGTPSDDPITAKPPSLVGTDKSNSMQAVLVEEGSSSKDHDTEDNRQLTVQERKEKFLKLTQNANKCFKSSNTNESKVIHGTENLVKKWKQANQLPINRPNGTTTGDILNVSTKKRINDESSNTVSPNKSRDDLVNSDSKTNGNQQKHHVESVKQTLEINKENLMNNTKDLSRQISENNGKKLERKENGTKDEISMDIYSEDMQTEKTSTDPSTNLENKHQERVDTTSTEKNENGIEMSEPSNGMSSIDSAHMVNNGRSLRNEKIQNDQDKISSRNENDLNLELQEYAADAANSSPSADHKVESENCSTTATAINNSSEICPISIEADEKICDLTAPKSTTEILSDAISLMQNAESTSHEYSSSVLSENLDQPAISELRSKDLYFDSSASEGEDDRPKQKMIQNTSPVNENEDSSSKKILVESEEVPLLASVDIKKTENMDDSVGELIIDIESEGQIRNETGDHKNDEKCVPETSEESLIHDEEINKMQNTEQKTKRGDCPRNLVDLTQFTFTDAEKKKMAYLMNDIELYCRFALASSKVEKQKVIPNIKFRIPSPPPFEPEISDHLKEVFAKIGHPSPKLPTPKAGISSSQPTAPTVEYKYEPFLPKKENVMPSTSTTVPSDADSEKKIPFNLLDEVGPRIPNPTVREYNLESNEELINKILYLREIKEKLDLNDPKHEEAMPENSNPGEEPDPEDEPMDTEILPKDRKKGIVYPEDDQNPHQPNPPNPEGNQEPPPEEETSPEPQPAQEEQPNPANPTAPSPAQNGIEQSDDSSPDVIQSGQINDALPDITEPEELSKYTRQSNSKECKRDDGSDIKPVPETDQDAKIPKPQYPKPKDEEFDEPMPITRGESDARSDDDEIILNTPAAANRSFSQGSSSNQVAVASDPDDPERQPQHAPPQEDAIPNIPEEPEPEPQPDNQGIPQFADGAMISSQNDGSKLSSDESTEPIINDQPNSSGNDRRNATTNRRRSVSLNQPTSPKFKPIYHPGTNNEYASEQHQETKAQIIFRKQIDEFRKNVGKPQDQQDDHMDVEMPFEKESEEETMQIIEIEIGGITPQEFLSTPHIESEENAVLGQPSREQDSLRSGGQTISGVTTCNNASGVDETSGSGDHSNSNQSEQKEATESTVPQETRNSEPTSTNNEPTGSRNLRGSGSDGDDDEDKNTQKRSRKKSTEPPIGSPELDEEQKAEGEKEKDKEIKKALAREFPRSNDDKLCSETGKELNQSDSSDSSSENYMKPIQKCPSDVTVEVTQGNFDEGVRTDTEPQSSTSKRKEAPTPEIPESVPNKMVAREIGSSQEVCDTNEAEAGVQSSSGVGEVLGGRPARITQRRHPVPSESDASDLERRQSILSESGISEVDDSPSEGDYDTSERYLDSRRLTRNQAAQIEAYKQQQDSSAVNEASSTRAVDDGEPSSTTHTVIRLNQNTTSMASDSTIDLTSSSSSTTTTTLEWPSESSRSIGPINPALDDIHAVIAAAMAAPLRPPALSDLNLPEGSNYEVETLFYRSLEGGPPRIDVMELVEPSKPVEYPSDKRKRSSPADEAEAKKIKTEASGNQPGEVADIHMVELNPEEPVSDSDREVESIMSSLNEGVGGHDASHEYSRKVSILVSHDGSERTQVIVYPPKRKESSFVPYVPPKKPEENSPKREKPDSSKGEDPGPSKEDNTKPSRDSLTKQENPSSSGQTSTNTRNRTSFGTTASTKRDSLGPKEPRKSQPKVTETQPATTTTVKAKTEAIQSSSCTQQAKSVKRKAPDPKNQGKCKETKKKQTDDDHEPPSSSSRSTKGTRTVRNKNVRH